MSQVQEMAMVASMRPLHIHFFIENLTPSLKPQGKATS